MGSQVFMDFVLIKSTPRWTNKIAVHSKGLSEHCTHTHTSFLYNGSGKLHTCWTQKFQSKDIKYQQNGV